MAAYAALVCLARLIDQILPQDQDYAFICDKKQMESLNDKVIHLQKILEYESTICVSSMVHVLESRIRDAAYQLEHIIESIICKQPGNTSSHLLLLSAIRRIGRNKDVTAVFFSCIAEIDIILEEAKAKKYPSAAPFSTTSSPRAVPTAEVTNVGLSNACTQMLDTITGHTSDLQIIPITGMGGIGKTTLASAVYNHSRSLHHFDVRLWVTISQDYDLQEVLRGLLSTVEQPESRSIVDVHKYLKRRRFLIVLDDMWHEKAWDGVRNAFPDDNNRSRIIVTTRELGVASYVGSLSNVHKMELLNEDHSWIMLREKVYGKEPCPAELDDIGRTVSRNCKGLPLSIVLIAGLLKRNKTIYHWKDVARNTRVAATDYDQLSSILSLSYTNLPPQLKACFLYFVAFPEDYKFQVKELAMLWTAEGFLKTRESKTMEDIAEECIEGLEERSLLLVKTRTHNGKIKTFSIHDVLRELSMKKAKEEKFLQQNNTSTVQNITKEQLKVSFLKNDLKFNSDTYSAHLRSFKYTIPSLTAWELIDHPLLNKIDKVINSGDDSAFIVDCLTSLSVLCKTTSLRYLHVVHSEYKRHITFPKSISQLQNLETFIIRSTFCCGVTIPLDIWKLPRLRHIVLGADCELQFPVANEGDYPILESLQTLDGVSNLNLSMDVIERIPNVKRMKLIYDYKHYKSPEYAPHNLHRLHQLEEFSIKSGSISDIVFPRNLKKLSLYDTNVTHMFKIGLLPYLEVLKLKGWSDIGDIWEPVDGEFLRLKYLKMEHLDIKEWRVESYHFPSLQKLEIIGCRYLEEVPECVGEIDTLEELVLYNCAEAKESVQKIQENQQAVCNDSLKITIIDWGEKAVYWKDSYK